MTLGRLVALVWAVGLAGAASAQTPYSYTYTFNGSPAGSGVVGVGNPAAPAGVVLSNVVRTGGITVSNQANVFASSNWGPLGAGGNHEFSIGPTAGNILHQTSVAFTLQRDANGPRDGSLVQPGVGSGYSLSNTSPVSSTYDFVSHISAEPVPHSFFHSGALTASGTLALDNLTLSGSTQSPSMPLALTAPSSNVLYAQTTPLNLSGAISGSIFVVSKEGVNVARLLADNTYAASFTAVNAGTLLVNNPGPGSGTGTGEVYLQSNNSVRLGGTGRVGNNVRVFAGRLLPGPGNAVGNLAVTGNVIYSSLGDGFDIYAGGTTASRVNISGTLDFSAGGLKTISIFSDGTMVAGNTYTYTITTQASTLGFNPANFNVVAGNFPGFLGSPIVTNPGGTSLVVQFTPVPEPATVLGICAAAAGGSGWLRRRGKVVSGSSG